MSKFKTLFSIKVIFPLFQVIILLALCGGIYYLHDENTKLKEQLGTIGSAIENVDSNVHGVENEMSDLQSRVGTIDDVMYSVNDIQTKIRRIEGNVSDISTQLMFRY